MEHKYCVPNDAVPSSTARAVGRKLGRLLDSLDRGIKDFDIENDAPWVSEELYIVLSDLKSSLIDGLKEDGWTVTIPKNRYRVRETKEEKNETSE